VRAFFLADINNEGSTKNPLYKKNLATLNNFIMFQFLNDTVVVPKESEWFGYFADGSLSKKLTLQQMPIYQQDWIGLKILDQAGKLQMLGCPGNHMQFSLDWFNSNVILPYLNNSL